MRDLTVTVFRSIYLSRIKKIVELKSISESGLKLFKLLKVLDISLLNSVKLTILIGR